MFGSDGLNKSRAFVALDLMKLIEFFAPTIFANFIKLEIFRGPVIPTWTGRVCFEINSLYKKYEDGDDDFIEKYYALLEAGGSVHYQNHLSKFKLNPKRRDFWQLGMNLIKNLMDDLEKLS